MTDQHQLAEQVLNGFTEIGSVPDGFADHVLEQIARRPSPDKQPDPLAEVNRKLDAILTLLRGTPE